MAKVVVFGVPGETGLWVADLGAGTVTQLAAPASGALAEANKLRASGGTVFKGVDLAVAAKSRDSVASGYLDG